MSHKIAKAARKEIRAQGRDPRQVELVPTKGYTGRNPITGAFMSFLGDRILKDFCGRALVKQLKKSMRTGALA